MMIFLACEQTRRVAIAPRRQSALENLFPG